MSRNTLLATPDGKLTASQIAALEWVRGGCQGPRPPAGPTLFSLVGRRLIRARPPGSDPPYELNQRERRA